MALNSFFHNKIEALELEIIERNSKLRRLEAQRNDLNSRGDLFLTSAASWDLWQTHVDQPGSTTTTRGVGPAPAARVICGGGCESNGEQACASEGTSRRKIWCVPSHAHHSDHRIMLAQLSPQWSRLRIALKSLNSPPGSEWPCYLTHIDWKEYCLVLYAYNPKLYNGDRY